MDNKHTNILVIDDIPENLQVIGNMLNSQGFETSFAQDGISALEIIEQTLPDLILLDITMPEIDGFEICKRIKNNNKTKSIPIIFLSSRAELDDVILGFNLGAADYVTKPFNSKELIARIHTHLQIKYQTDQILQLNAILSQNNKNITDSILYAKRIQSAMLPSVKILAKTFPNHFILYKAKDIVSGDFFWFEKIDNFLYIVSGDCTGHGVPGAFMSILSMALLYQIVEQSIITNNILSPNLILNKLRYNVIRMLTKDNDNPGVYDGLDISVVLINTANNHLQFAGANQALTIVHKQITSGITENPVSPYLTILQPDRMPIGPFSESAKEFSNAQLQLQNGDLLYVWSDGYASQLGGKYNKPLTSKRLRETIAGIRNESVSDQKAILEQKLENWQGNANQTDDILIIGVKINN